MNDSALFCNPLEIENIAFKMQKLLSERDTLKSGDKLQLRDAILSVYNHPENLCQYSSCARHEVESMLLPERVVDKYEEIVKSVCQEKMRCR